MLFTLFFFTTLLAAADPQFGTSTITIGAGTAIPGSGYRAFRFQTGAAFTVEYEFRLHKFFAATIGMESDVHTAKNYGREPQPDSRERITRFPFGLRTILPIASGRLELFAGTGGAPYTTSDYQLSNTYQKNTVLWHVNGGFRAALDAKQRFFLGPTVRHYRDVGRPTEQWTSLTAEFGFRF